MKAILALTVVTLASAMYALPASAGCSDPRNAGVPTGLAHMLAQRSANSESGRSQYHSIVGTWEVTYFAADGSESAEAFIQWHSDGTEWEDINFPILGGNVCLGSWKVLDAHRVARNHYGWIFTDGVISNFFNMTETVTLSEDGRSYTGINETKIYLLDGTFLVSSTGTSSATRIEP